VASIIRGERAIVPRGDEAIMPGDRVVVIGSPAAAKAWSGIMAKGVRPIDDVVVFGGGQTGLAIARVLLGQGIRVRVVESREERAREVAEELPEARVYWATGVDADFLERERIGYARAAIFAMREDAKNLYAATLARVHGIGFTIAIVHEPVSVEVFERAGLAGEPALLDQPRLQVSEQPVGHGGHHGDGRRGRQGGGGHWAPHDGSDWIVTPSARRSASGR
jgi:trk system potassium uptake protein